MKIKALLALMLSIFMFILFGCNKSDVLPEIADDEILLMIQLDIKEDIGLLVVNYDADGISGSGGTSNANKSLMKHNELIYYSLDGKNFENLSEIKDLSLQFTIISDYFTPNYDNIYPTEYTKPLEEIHLPAQTGESYAITITGDKANGYTAVLDK